MFVDYNARMTIGQLVAAVLVWLGVLFVVSGLSDHDRINAIAGLGMFIIGVILQLKQRRES